MIVMVSSMIDVSFVENIGRKPSVLSDNDRNFCFVVVVFCVSVPCCLVILLLGRPKTAVEKLGSFLLQCDVMKDGWTVFKER